MRKDVCEKEPQVAEQDKDYHIARARAELDLAYQAQHESVANAHMKLSALHMEQIRHPDEACGGADGALTGEKRTEPSDEHAKS